MMMNIPTYHEGMEESGVIKELGPEKLIEGLEAYEREYSDVWLNASQRKYFHAYLQGLLSDLERKSIEPIALAFLGEKGVRGLQQFFKRNHVPEQALEARYQTLLSEAISEEGGMLSVDGSDFVKKGNHSAGVKRQYCGRLGKTENCQAGVFIAYASSRGYGLVEKRLYMPECWFEQAYAQRREKCEISGSVVFQTKNEMASQLVKSILKAGKFSVQWIGCDAAFGCDHAFLESLPQDVYYFAGVKSDELVFLSMPQMLIPSSAGKPGRRFKYPRPSVAPVPVSSIAKDESIPWERIVLAQGAKGPILADVKCIRGVSCTSTTQYGNHVAPCQEVWIYLRRYEDGTIKYFLSNAPAQMPIAQLHRAATLRWPIEQCFEECKSNLGMAHYESRTYQGWHRHMQMVMIAHLFTLRLRCRLKKTASL